MNGFRVVICGLMTLIAAGVGMWVVGAYTSGWGSVQGACLVVIGGVLLFAAMLAVGQRGADPGRGGYKTER